MATNKTARLSADQVLVTVGTVCGVSSLGTTPTQRALVAGQKQAIAHAAFDAGLIDLAAGDSGPQYLVRGDSGATQPITLAEIESRWGEQLRKGMGVRPLPPEANPERLPSDLGAPLPHDFVDGGLRRLMGLTFEGVRGSYFREMFGLFQNEPHLGPSVQAQLFLYGGIGALAALPIPLSKLVPQAHRFRVAASCAFIGIEHNLFMRQNMQVGSGDDGFKADRLAYRLSASLNTHGPALINALLAPAYGLSKVRKNPKLLQQLLDESGVLSNVPQAPMVSSGACASALITLNDIAPQLLHANYPGSHAPKLVVWTASDAALRPDGYINEGFGPAALMSSEKLRELNQGREGHARRPVSEAIAPFDQDASGTLIGEAGSGVVVTTLQYAVEHHLDITSILVGWGQSGETGGKAHFAGVGFGGENALVNALRMAHVAHGYGVSDFAHSIAHATGTRTNSRTDLTTITQALNAAATEQRHTGHLKRLTVSAPKALGDAHTMGESGLRGAAEAIYYCLGEPCAGIPSLRTLDPELADCADRFVLQREAIAGDEDGGAIVHSQGFGGYDGSLALRGANNDALRRYHFDDPKLLDAYLERRGEIRAQRVASERAARQNRGSILALAEKHCWPGAAE